MKHVSIGLPRSILGRTGLQVSAISLGTVSLGVDYGIRAQTDFGRPSETEVIDLIRRAADAGITLFDTAPAYGTAEGLVGRALRGRRDCIIATKVAVPIDDQGALLHGVAVRRSVQESIERSLTALQRDAIDLLQIHNATAEVIAVGELTAVLQEARRQGKVRFLGASVYTEAEGLAIIADGGFDTLQVPYNVLDQRMAPRVFPAAERAGVGIVARSALLKGVLTSKSRWLPSDLDGLRVAAERAREVLSAESRSLPEGAVRFCLSAPAVATVLVGVRVQGELDAAIHAGQLGPLSEGLSRQARELALDDERLLNPTYWPIQ